MASNNQSGLFPDLPRSQVVVNKDTGEMTVDWYIYFQQMNQALQTNFNNEGLVVPKQTATNIAGLGNTQSSIGTMIYDTTNKQFKGIILDVAGDPPTTLTKTFQLV